MKLNRREILAMLGAVSVAGLVGSANASSEAGAFRGKTFVAACPAVTESIPRTPGPQRVMVIGAHPDDADITCGCTAAKLVAKGARVKFVAVCNGNIGHHVYDRAKTAAIARAMS